MYINALGMRGVHSQTVQNTGSKTGTVGQYDYNTVLQRALEKRNAAIGSVSAGEGDMIITLPAYEQNNAGPKDISDQEKCEMSMKEYRTWFRNEVAAIRSESRARSPYISDMLVIKEEAFEKMKSDPAWEKEVFGKIREHSFGQETVGTKSIGYQIIGASPESCHEEEIPVRTTYPLLTAGGYRNGLLSGQTGFSDYLTQGWLSGQNSLGMLSSAAYRNVMNGGLGNSLLGTFML
ncbi:MAG: hypothetical protein HFI51_02255 [Lachnospiraceae bacterium]|nr:hypothetical protein [Lachnospiraceae bacterium]